MIVLAHDFETTGVDARTCGVVQTAILIVDIQEDGTWEVLAREYSMHNPGEPIPLGASKVHGVYDSDVEDYDHFEISVPPTYEQAFAEFPIEGVLGYNSISFDDVIARRLGLPEGTPPVDLMIAARRMKESGALPRARLIDAYEGLVGDPADNAHDALADVTMTLDLVAPAMKFAGVTRFTDFVKWLHTPQMTAASLMAFGKHKGMPLNTIPKSYLRWALKNMTNLDADLRSGMTEALSGH